MKNVFFTTLLVTIVEKLWTVDNFHLRQNDYKCCSCKHAEGKSGKQQHIYDHLMDKNHKDFVQNVSVTLIDKTDSSDLLEREKYRRDTLKRFTPNGLNISESL